VLPGALFSPWMAIYQLQLELAAMRRADVLVGDFGYDRAREVLEAPEEEHWRVLTEDAQALWEARGAREHRRVSIVAKSLGTRQAAALLERGVLPEGVSIVWLTPTLKSPRVRAASAACGRSLWIAGTADPHYMAEGWREVTSRPGARGLLVEGVGHGLDDPVDPRRTLRALESMVEATDEWLYEGSRDAATEGPNPAGSPGGSGDDAGAPSRPTAERL
jgi:hypothetical protein